MIKTLAMRKMEKNFIAVITKHRPRYPYKTFSIPFLLHRLDDELQELIRAHTKKDLENMKDECADISNLIEYLYEKLQQTP